jgi:hypothetical protein
MARYTGTFLGGPYDGEIRDYDSKFIVREDPPDEEFFLNQFRILTEIPMTVTDSMERIYEWVMDDDGRGWWVPLRGATTKWA